MTTQSEKLGFNCRECGEDSWIAMQEPYVNIYECTGCSYPELIFEHEITVKRKKKKPKKEDEGIQD
jgi:Zn ribbon nucleic-acid-binding protein